MGRGGRTGAQLKTGGGSTRRSQKVETITIKGTFDRDFPVTPGVIDEAAEEAFMSGQCHALAYEVHKRTGWEIAGLLDVEKDVFHLFNITPEGKAVDIMGSVDHKEYHTQEHFDGDARYMRRRIKPETVETMGPETDWVKPDFDSARLFVDAVVERYS